MPRWREVAVPILWPVGFLFTSHVSLGVYRVFHFCMNFLIFLIRFSHTKACRSYRSVRNDTIFFLIYVYNRSQWPRGLRRRSTAARLLGLWVRILPVAWMFVCCECCVLSGRGLCDGLITLPEESHWLCCVVLCDLETSCIRRPWPTGGGGGKKEVHNFLKIFSGVKKFLNVNA